VEAEHIINKYGNRLKSSSLVGENGAREYNDFRTSTSAFLLQSEDSIIRDIEARIEKYANTTLPKIEPLQLLNYKKGQQFKPHTDWFGRDYIKSEKGQR